MKTNVRNTKIRPELGARKINPTREESTQTRYVAQIILYLDGGTQIVEGTATILPDGTLQIDARIGTPPPAGTSVQVVIYRGKKPLVFEGTTTAPDADGSFEVIPL